MKGKTLYQMSIATLRYALGRDNHLAPFTAMENINEALNHMDNEYKVATMMKIISEIESDLKLHKREYAGEWLEFIEGLRSRI